MRQVPSTLASKLYSAAPLIADRGLADSRIDDIADVTGIPKATLYYYFAGKEEILAFLLRDVLELVAGAVGTAVSSPGTARDRLQSAVSAQLRVMLENPDVCRALLGDLGRATRLPELALALRTAFHDPIERLLRDGVKDGTIREVADPPAVALSIFGAVTVAGLSAMVEETAENPVTVAERATQAVSDFMLLGLSPAQTGK